MLLMKRSKKSLLIAPPTRGLLLWAVLSTTKEYLVVEKKSCHFPVRNICYLVIYYFSSALCVLEALFKASRLGFR